MLWNGHEGRQGPSSRMTHALKERWSCPLHGACEGHWCDTCGRHGRLVWTNGRIVVIPPGAYNDAVMFTGDGHAFVLTLPEAEPMNTHALKES